MSRVGGRGRANAAQQRSDTSRQLFGRERLGEVVVGACLEAGDDVVGVVAGGHHDDRYVARASDGAAQLEAVDARQHDVDQHDVGRHQAEQLDRLLAALGLVDRPALVLEGQLDGGTDAFVVLDGQDARTHVTHDAANGPRIASNRPAGPIRKPLVRPCVRLRWR